MHNDFRNKHWSNSNANSNAVENPEESVTVNIDYHVPVKKCTSKTKANQRSKSRSGVDWDRIIIDIQNQRTYDDLENYVMSLNDGKFEKLFRMIVPV